MDLDKDGDRAARLHEWRAEKKRRRKTRGAAKRTHEKAAHEKPPTKEGKDERET